MKKSLLIFFCTLLSFHVFGQGLTITSGNKVKNFKPGSWYEIVVKGKYNGAQPCDQLLYKGTITQVSADSLTLSSGHITISSVVESTSIVHEMVFAGQRARTTFAVEDMVGLKHYKSEKAQKRKNAIGIIGGVMMFTGAVTALNAFLVDDSSSRKNILLSGGIQVGLGITFVSFGGSKRYYFRDRDEIWKVVGGK